MHVYYLQKILRYIRLKEDNLQDLRNVSKCTCVPRIRQWWAMDNGFQRGCGIKIVINYFKAHLRQLELA